MSAEPRTALHDPVEHLPQRRPGAIRRTTMLESVPRGTWSDGIIWSGTARDAVVSPAGGLHTTRTAHLSAVIDGDGLLHDLNTGAADLAPLVGTSVSRGFRARIAALRIDEEDELVGALLDDLPTVRIVTGYARAHQDPEAIASADHSFMVGVCTGWSHEHMPLRRLERGTLASLGPAPIWASMLNAPDDFHAEGPLARVSMRRRRILEVVRDGDELDVLEYFRDSHVDAQGVESALHEYVVRARIDPADGTVRQLAAEPRSLPFGECPLAVLHLPALVGRPVHDIDTLVRTELRGGRGCTHLNDTVRFLRYAPGLDPARQPH